MNENCGACGAAFMAADRVGPPLRHAFSPQQGRVSRRTGEGAA
ncbi:hypothetical protein LY41_004312 [Prauserella halophila]|nr:hypothetical protein [Prauserella halophila]